LAGVGSFAESSLAKPLSGGVVKEDAILFSCPNGVGGKEARALYLEKKAAGLVQAGDARFLERSLPRVKMVNLAKSYMNIAAKFVQGWQGQDDLGAHRRCHGNPG
jgi:hypothetical protein